MGYLMTVAALEDVLLGRIWANADGERRKRKRQKDLADILRLVEACPQLEERLPDSIKIQIRDGRHSPKTNSRQSICRFS